MHVLMCLCACWVDTGRCSRGAWSGGLCWGHVMKRVWAWRQQRLSASPRCCCFTDESMLPRQRLAPLAAAAPDSRTAVVLLHDGSMLLRQQRAPLAAAAPDSHAAVVLPGPCRERVKPFLLGFEEARGQYGGWAGRAPINT
jgi:hypothetical protein